MLALHDAHGPMLSRKLLYTAVTRAKAGVVIVGQKSAIEQAVSTPDIVHRCTNLAGRLVETLQRSL